MANLVIQHVDDETYDWLKRRAEANGRALEEEVKMILTQAVKPTLEESRERLKMRLKERFGDRVLSDSSLLLREDRDR